MATPRRRFCPSLRPTFEEKGGHTQVVVRELYPSKQAVDSALADGSAGGIGEETFEQLGALLVNLTA